MSTSIEEKAAVIIAALGGKENIVRVYSCSTRLRVEVKDTKITEWDKIRTVGALGVVESGTVIQAIFGAETENYKNEVNRQLTL